VSCHAERDYASFGRIVFQRSQYDRAVRRAVADATAIE